MTYPLRRRTAVLLAAAAPQATVAAPQAAVAAPPAPAPAGAATADAPDGGAGGSGLRRHLTLPQAVALAVTIVVGSGALVLPGIAFEAAGTAAIWAWALAAAAVVPLLLIFARLGGAYPTAGGVAGFVQAAFGRRHAGAVELVFVGTFGLGIPAIALTGGNYLAGLGIYPTRYAWLGAVAMLVAACGLNVAGVKLSARVQTVLAAVLAVGLLVAGVAGLGAGDATVRMPELTGDALSLGLGSIGLVFFAFTGWEMLAFTAEEYRRPKRDFPLAVGISFVLVTALYAVLALAVQSRLPTGDDRLATAPVQAVVADAVSPGWGRTVALLGAVIIMANLIGAVWGASRLVMSSAREGLMPRSAARISGRGVPAVAVAACGAGFAAVVVASSAGWLPLDLLLSVAGQNFFLLYLLSVAAYVKLFTGRRHRVFGVVVGTVLSAVALSFGATLLYAVGLFGVGWVLAGWAPNRAAVPSARLASDVS